MTQAAEIGMRLKEERKRLGLRQSDICQAIGLKPNTNTVIWRWERGAVLPTALHWARLHSLGFDIVYVLTGERARHAQNS